MASLKKESAESYSFQNNGEFAFIVINKTGPYLTLVVDSSYGVFSNTFYTNHENSLEFLKSLSFDYLMNKLTDGKGKEVDTVKLLSSLTSEIKELRKEKSISKDTARELLDEVTEIVQEFGNSEPLLGYVLINSDFASVNPTDSILSSSFPMKWKESYEYFWKELWVPFLAEVTKQVT